MRNRNLVAGVRLLSGLLLAVLVGCESATSQPDSSQQRDLRPNILLIVADDMGYSDLGAIGGEIPTPNLDQLAAAGSLLTSFHTAPTCGPSRAMLLTGIDHHRVGLGANAAAIQRLTELQGLPGYEGHLNERALTISTLLQDAGYQTWMAGKWDLGSVPGALPSERGFDHSFTLLQSGASHFADARGTFPFEPDAQYLEDGAPVNQLPEDFYSTRFYTDWMRDRLAERDPGRPFFGYVAYTAPHWPLQVPDNWLDRFAGAFDDGWEASSQRRLENLVESGLVDAIPDRGLARGVTSWSDLSAEERQRQARLMEIYAAMVAYMDEQIGRLLSDIESLPGDRPTWVIFLSDNGPEGNAIDRIGDTGAWIAANFDNSFVNYGRENSYLWPGPGWSQVSAQPLELYKSWVAEGGIRTPAIVWSNDRNLPDRTTAVTMIKDVPATILELAGIEHPGSNYRGMDVLPIEGQSLLPLLDGSVDALHDERPIGWELYGNRALIRGDWKVRLIWPPEGNGEWQLFNIGNDPAELRDLAGQNPGLLAELVAEWEQYVEENGMYVYDRELGYGRH